ncbi:MAG TPA: Asp-tRNA(Asn)/Glu-tRNA(Gln) amidotransferase subunit GatC [Cyclobacteriaceae bacterium]|nr:Asp-tRNA(Asn)/Glu-tRNA(Gln) amidotransferase subunit GatC [Cyclobacteriaceae bacterium]HRK52587.1 Asp-tRNA(Asn)/Glu-tRNA(Gln) amidotransferase subunit GatC [Cyclobacteriaceae bacterium]
MKIDKETLSKMAHLARLEIDEKDAPKMLEDMSKMVSFVEKLNEVDTEGIEPLTTMSHEVNALREDVVKNQLSKEEVLKNAPKKDSDFFRVPKVLE